jgi:hypothetical protein
MQDAAAKKKKKRRYIRCQRPSMKRVKEAERGGGDELKGSDKNSKHEPVSRTHTVIVCVGVSRLRGV